MASYTAHCAHCDTYIDFYRPIAERDDTPTCCDTKSTRVLSAPMIPQMGLADHYTIKASDGRTYYGKYFSYSDLQIGRASCRERVL